MSAIVKYQIAGAPKSIFWPTCSTTKSALFLFWYSAEKLALVVVDMLIKTR